MRRARLYVVGLSDRARLYEVRHEASVSLVVMIVRALEALEALLLFAWHSLVEKRVKLLLFPSVTEAT